MAELTEHEQEVLDHERSVLAVYDTWLHEHRLAPRAVRAAARVAELEAKVKA